MALRTLFFLIIIVQVTFGQTNQQNDRSKAYKFIDSLLVKDNYTAEFLDFEIPKDISDISMRFQKAVMEKKEWFASYSRNYKEGTGLPYHENFGITKEEYQKIINLDKASLPIVIRSTAPLKTDRNANVFTFKVSDNTLKFLESMKIDFKNEVLVFLNDTIPFKGEINAPASTPFGEWHGYSWHKENSTSGENDEIKFDSLVATITEVDFGRIKKNNKILLRLKYKSVDKGSVKANLDLACYLN